MRKPTAPCLTADYYTYSTYSPRDDYYGGLEVTNQSAKNSRNDGPIRMEPGAAAKDNSKKIKEPSSSLAHCISFFYCAIALIIFAFGFYMYHSGVQSKVVFYLTIYMGVVILTSFLMHVGIIRQQPFFCIPFVVMRILETFVVFAAFGVITYALIQPQSNQFMFLFQCVKMASRVVGMSDNINLGDATFQLSIIAWCITLFILSIFVYVCRVSFRCTLTIADQVRYNRYSQNFALRQSRLAGDEFYCA